MLVNNEIINELYDNAGNLRVEKARIYMRTGRTEIEKIHYNNSENFEITGKVTGQEVYRTHIYVSNGEIEDLTCECVDYQNRYAACKHIVATMMEFTEKSRYEEMLKKQDNVHINKNLNIDSKYRSFKQIVNTFYSEEMQEINQEKEIEKNEEKVKIEPKLIYDKYTNNLRIEFRIGNQRMYKLKNLSEFYDRMLNHEKYKYGNKLEFIHKKENFEEKNQELLEFILKGAEIIRFVNSEANSNYRYYGKVINEDYISLRSSDLDEIFNILKSGEILFQKEYKDEKIQLRDENPDLHFILERKDNKEFRITINKKIDILREIEILQGEQYKYILINNILYRCDKKYEQTILRLLKMFKDNFLT